MRTPLTDQILTRVRDAASLMLWELGAVQVNLEQPFKLVSGNFSPIYINCRRLISSPAFADLFGAATRIICDAYQVQFDVVAGGETAGIPFAAILARNFGKPMVYVRKAAKGHGIESLVEGVLPPGSRVLLSEDLITDAGSKLRFIQAIKDEGCTVPSVLVVFDRLQGGGETLSSMNIRLFSITDMQTTIRVAQAAGLFGESEFNAVQNYLRSPRDWHSERNLSYSG
jgi:orotate phosphoribosyltransferase